MFFFFIINILCSNTSRCSNGYVPSIKKRKQPQKKLNIDVPDPVAAGPLTFSEPGISQPVAAVQLTLPEPGISQPLFSNNLLHKANENNQIYVSNANYSNISEQQEEILGENTDQNYILEGENSYLML